MTRGSRDELPLSTVPHKPFWTKGGGDGRRGWNGGGNTIEVYRRVGQRNMEEEGVGERREQME